MHPIIAYDLARHRQSELQDEARRERLVRRAADSDGADRKGGLVSGWSVRRLLRGLSFLGGPFQAPGGRVAGAES